MRILFAISLALATSVLAQTAPSARQPFTFEEMNDWVDQWCGN